MTICSLVLQAIPKHIETVTRTLGTMEGVEIHVQDEHGKLIVSIDHPSRRHCSKIMTNMTHIEGVMSTSLVFEYQEDLEPEQNTVVVPTAQPIQTQIGDNI